jgi:GTP-binding protein EngB required for normal cell division
MFTAIYLIIVIAQLILSIKLCLINSKLKSQNKFLGEVIENIQRSEKCLQQQVTVLETQKKNNTDHKMLFQILEQSDKKVSWLITKLEKENNCKIETDPNKKIVNITTNNNVKQTN